MDPRAKTRDEKITLKKKKSRLIKLERITHLTLAKRDRDLPSQLLTVLFRSSTPHSIYFYYKSCDANWRAKNETKRKETIQKKSKKKQKRKREWKEVGLDKAQVNIG